MLADTIKTEDFPVNDILHPITRHSPHHSLEKRLQNSYFEGPNEACGRVIVVRTTPDAARRRPHVPPPCPKPLQPKTCPAPASPAPFTPAVMAVDGGKREGSVPAHQPSATSCLARATARPEGGDSRPIGRQHRRHHLDGPAPAQHQGVEQSAWAAHRANQDATDDKEGLGGWRRRAPVGRHAQGEGRAVCSPYYLTCHHMRAQNCRPERLWTAPPR
jgi:hypothetical protein